MSNQTVLVTGAGRGIGRAIAVRLAHSGWRVYGGVRTDVAAKELAEESDLITPVELDVTSPTTWPGSTASCPSGSTPWSTTPASPSLARSRRCPGPTCTISST